MVAKSSSVNIVTYNVLHPYQHNAFPFLPNNGQDWVSRIGIIADNILKCASGLLCVQEISQDHFKDLKGRIGHMYDGFHTKHDGHHGAMKQDGVAVFYRKDQLHLKTVKTCDKTNRSTTSRRDLYIDVEEPINHRIIRCAAAHIEGNPKDLETGNQQLREIIHHLSSPHPTQDYTVDAIILGCDLNQTQDTERFKILKDANFEVSVFPGEESEVGRNRQIDWIFVKTFNPNFQLQNGQSIQNAMPLGSDHRMVSSLLNIDFEQKKSKVPVEETPIKVPSPVTPSHVDIIDETEFPPDVQITSDEIPAIPEVKSQWEKFTERMSDIFSGKNALWLVPLSLLTLGIVPLLITIYHFFYYNILKY